MAPSPFDAPPSRHGVPLPTLLHEGLDAIGPAIAARGWTRALIVVDPGLRSAGHLGPLQTRLQESGVAVHLFDDVRPEPTEADAQRCAEAITASGADVLVALGGGSALDTAKLGSFLATNPGPIEQHHGPGAPANPLLPLVAIPTTAGTGSEVQSFALVQLRSGRKLACGAPGAMPVLTLLCPELTHSCPAQVTAMAGLDALVHAVECYVTTARTEASAAHARHAFRLLRANLPAVLADPHNATARAAMLTGSVMAGQAIEASMLGAAHATANALSAAAHVPHGNAVAIMLPHVIRHNARDPDVAQRYTTLAQDLPTPGSDAHALADDLSALLRATGLPSTPTAWGLHAADAPRLADEAATQWTLRFNPVAFRAAELHPIFRDAMGR